MPIKATATAFKVTITTAGKRVSRVFATHADAHKWEVNAKAALVNGQSLTDTAMPSQATVNEAYTAAYNRYWAHSKSENSSRLLADQVVAYFGGDSLVQNIGPSEVDAFIEAQRKLGNKPATINRKVSCLSRILKTAKSNRWTTLSVELPHQKEINGRIRWLTKSEEQQLMDALTQLGHTAHVDLFRFLVDTGCRVGEAFKLDWRDITDAGASFWDTKNGGSRTVPFTARIRSILAARLAQGLASPFADITRERVNAVWNAARTLLGLDGDTQFVPHCLRHTCASRLVQAGVPVMVVKEFLGHRSLAMTQRYAHLSPACLVRAAEALEQ